MRKTSKRAKTLVLGNIVSDPASGFTGTAIQMTELTSGTIQIGVQPRVDPKTPHVLPDALDIDANLLDFVSDGIAHKAGTPEETVFQLGDVLRERVIGVEGEAVQKTTFLNGCVYFQIQPKATFSEKGINIPPMIHASQGRFELVRRGNRAEQPKATAAVKPPGGPNQRSLRMT